MAGNNLTVFGDDGFGTSYPRSGNCQALRPHREGRRMDIKPFPGIGGLRRIGVGSTEVRDWATN
jgi:hypothetical protein